MLFRTIRLRSIFSHPSIKLVAFTSIVAISIPTERLLRHPSDSSIHINKTPSATPQRVEGESFSAKLELGRNIATENAVVQDSSVQASSYFANSLSHQKRSLLGLLVLGSLGFFASLRPFEAKK